MSRGYSPLANAVTLSFKTGLLFRRQLHVGDVILLALYHDGGLDKIAHVECHQFDPVANLAGGACSGLGDRIERSDITLHGIAFDRLPSAATEQGQRQK